MTNGKPSPTWRNKVLQFHRQTYQQSNCKTLPYHCIINVITLNSVWPQTSYVWTESVWFSRCSPNRASYCRPVLCSCSQSTGRPLARRWPPTCGRQWCHWPRHGHSEPSVRHATPELKCWPEETIKLNMSAEKSVECRWSHIHGTSPYSSPIVTDLGLRT